MSKFPIAVPQWNRLSENAGNVAEAPPVADKARRCWRKTRSIAPAPRAIGDYVLRGLCGGLQSKPSPRSSQTASTTAARLLEACSSGVIKSLTLLFCVLLQVSQARPCVRLRKSGSGLNANPLPPKRVYLMLTLWFISQPVPKNRPTETRSWKMTPVTPKERSFADIEDPNENISPFSPGETIMGT